MLYSPKTAEGIFQVLLNTKGVCFTIWKSSPFFTASYRDADELRITF